MVAVRQVTGKITTYFLRFDPWQLFIWTVVFLHIEVEGRVTRAQELDFLDWNAGSATY